MIGGAPPTERDGDREPGRVVALGLLAFDLIGTARAPAAAPTPRIMPPARFRALEANPAYWRGREWSRLDAARQAEAAGDIAWRDRHWREAGRFADEADFRRQRYATQAWPTEDRAP